MFEITIPIHVDLLVPSAEPRHASAAVLRQDDPPGASPVHVHVEKEAGVRNAGGISVRL